MRSTSVGIYIWIGLGEGAHGDSILFADGVESLIWLHGVKTRGRMIGHRGRAAFVWNHEHLSLSNRFIRHAIEGHDVAGADSVRHGDAPKAVTFSHFVASVGHQGGCLGGAGLD